MSTRTEVLGKQLSHLWLLPSVDIVKPGPGSVVPRRRRSEVRLVVEIIIGVLYALGAVGQTVFVLRNSSKFYSDMADRAWFPPSELLIRRVLLPHSVVVTVLVILLEAGLAVGILTGGASVGPALVVGGLFSILGGITGSPGETIGYWALAGVHFWLASGQ